MSVVAAEDYGALDARLTVPYTVAGTYVATPLGIHHLALESAEEVQRMEETACQARPVERVMLHVSQPVPVAEKQTAAGRTVSGELERYPVPWYLAGSSYAKVVADGLLAEEVLAGVLQLCWAS